MLSLLLLPVPDILYQTSSVPNTLYQTNSCQDNLIAILLAVATMKQNYFVITKAAIINQLAQATTVTGGKSWPQLTGGKAAINS